MLLNYSAESNLKRVLLELGGKNPQVVLEDAGDLDYVARQAVNCVFWNMGENCSSGSRLIVHRKLKDKLLAKMIEVSKEWIVGDPLDPATKIGPMIEESHMKKVLGYIESGKNEGARLALGGKRTLLKTGGFFVEATIFDQVKPSMRIAREEIFGPVLSVLSFNTEEEAIALANDTTYGLTASVYTQDISRAHRVARALRAGTVSVNCFSEGDATTPFGGFKQSGFFGRDKSIFAHYQYTEAEDHLDAVGLTDSKNKVPQMKKTSPKTDRSSFRGMFAALVTPMNANEEIDFPQLTAFTDYLVRKGVHGLIPLGSTGEYYALSADERERVLRSTLEVVAGRVPVVAGANAGSTRDVIAYARQAEQLGCAGVMLAAPYYSLPRPEELFAHFRAVNNAIGIPIILYNYPGRTGVDMPPEFIERLAGLKNLRYVKESTGEMPRITELLRRCGDRLGVFCGCDTIALESLMVGAIGWIGGVVNVLPKSHVSLYELTVDEEGLCGRAKTVLPDAADARTDGRRGQIHPVRQSRLRPRRPPGRPAAPAPADPHRRGAQPSPKGIEQDR